MTDERPRIRRRTRLLLVAAAVLAVVAGVGAVVGPRLYARAVNGSAAAAPALTGTPHRSITAPASTGTWTATPQSFAGYRVHEVLQGQNVNVVGRTNKVTASAGITDGRLRSATVTVQVGSIHTPEAARDAYFRSTALQTGTFPTATFQLTRPTDLTAALRGGAASVQLTGNLTLHGVTRPETLRARVGAQANRNVQVVGSVPITFSDFHVTAPSLGFVTVDGHGAVEFSLELHKQA
jgi:polyisoprenoid-binding protein YceI